MIHYVNNLEVEPIKINGIDTATFSEYQTSLCGLRLKVKSRKEFATQLNGIGMVNCPDCLDKWREIINRPIDCKRCKKTLELNDINKLSQMDTERLCLDCRQK